jgi:Tol biopolymer transport system component
VARRDGWVAHRLTKQAYLDRQPAWSPDGARLAYVHMTSFDLDTGRSAVYTVNASGTGSPRQLTADAFSDQVAPALIRRRRRGVPVCRRATRAT